MTISISQKITSGVIAVAFAAFFLPIAWHPTMIRRAAVDSSNGGQNKTDLFFTIEPRLAKYLKGWQPKYISIGKTELPGYYPVDYSRLFDESDRSKLLTAAKAGTGFSTLRGQFNVTGSERISEPFEGVVVKLSPTAGGDGTQIFWIIPMTGDTNSQFRQTIADTLGRLTVNFPSGNGAAIVDWTQPDGNTPGTISVVCLGLKSFTIENQVYPFNMDSGLTAEKVKLQNRLQELIGLLTQVPPLPQDQIDKISQEGDTIKARLKEIGDAEDTQ
jgi:hypothetical protein